MFGLRYIKVGPTTYILHFKNGKIRREGAGLAFYYFAPNSTIVTVPLAGVDVPFVFNQTSADFQTVTVQGQISYRVRDPKKLAGMLDFSIGRNGKHQTSDPEKLNDRLVAVAQVLTSSFTQELRLREALTAFEPMTQRVLAGLRESETIAALGVEVLALLVLSISATPEMTKALEAEAREELQRRSDEAVYARRNASVELERRIRESELNTELLVEEKQRQKREAQLNGQVLLEERRRDLVDRQTENEKKMADTRSYATEASLKPFRGMDYRVIMALGAGQIKPQTQLAMAFRELAENAQKIGELNISPDLLNSLLRSDTAGESIGDSRARGA